MEKSSFFNSINGDRRYKADEFAAYFASFIGDGVFPLPSTGLQVMEGEGTAVTLSAGKAWINGYFYANTDDLTISLDTADGVLNRIDRIVIRWDLAERRMRVRVKSSGFATTPSAPALQRDADAFELCVADVYVGKGVTNITQANITDKRLDSALCGIVTQTVKELDTRTFALQLESWFAQYQAQATDTFNEWFSSLQEVMEGDIALNMMNLINTLTGRVVALEERPVSKGGGAGALYYDGSKLATVDLSVPYNEDGDKWEIGKDMPTARHLATPILKDNKIYAIGGYAGAFSNKLEIYDIPSSTWTTGADMPTYRANHTSTLKDNKIYVIGGNAAGFSNKLEIYDIPSNTWTTGTNMPTDRANHTSILQGDKIYVIGGMITGNNYSNKTEIYDIPSNTWTTGAYMPTARWYHTSVIEGDKIYVLGGTATGAVVTNKLEIYDIPSNTWATGTNIPTARQWLMLILKDKKIYAIGGNAAGISNKLEIYDIPSNTWTTGADMPTARYLSTSILKGDKIYIIAGSHIANTASNKTEIYDIPSNTWTTGANIPTARWYHTSVIEGDKIYVIGGSIGGSNYSNKTEIYNVDVSYTNGVLMGAAQKGMAITSADWIILDYDGEVELAHLANQWKELDRDCRILAPKGEKVMVGLKDG